MLWYAINLFIIFIFLLLLLMVREADKRWSRVQDYLGVVTATVNSVRFGDLGKKIKKINPKSYETLTESINQLIDALNDREKMVAEQQTELIRQNKFLEAILNSLSDGLLIVDENHKILRATPKILQWFNLKGKEILNKDLLNYIEIPGLLQIEKLENDEVFIKDFSADAFEASSMKVMSDDKKKKYIIILKNVTNQKELENLKEDFVATLTHDLKVPIIAEANILDFLLEEKFGDITQKQKEALLNMKTSNNELIELVQILLETYKVNDTGMSLYYESFQITSFLEDIIHEMSPIAEKSELKLKIKGTEDFIITADKLQLKRVIKNLIQNAISHSDSRSAIDVTKSTTKDYVTISIVDYGKGISKEDLTLVFKKYYSTAKKFRKIGTGLGLYLSQKIIKSHGGEIIINSEKNVSTEFCIKIPRTPII